MFRDVNVRSAGRGGGSLLDEMKSRMSSSEFESEAESVTEAENRKFLVENTR